MPRINRLVLGIRPAQKMFRVGALGGLVIDSVLAALDDKLLGLEYFTEVGRGSDNVSFRLSDEERHNVLRVEDANVVFTKDYYTTEKHVEPEKALGEWRVLWKALNSVLKVRDIRRIGIAAEHQLPVRDGTPSNRLFRAFASGDCPVHTGRFQLQYEDRRHTTNKVGLPDRDKDAFTNVIWQYYDSELDVDSANAGHFNANIDVQKYYAPLFNGDMFDEVMDVYKLFLKEEGRLDSELKKRGLA